MVYFSKIRMLYLSVILNKCLLWLVLKYLARYANSMIFVSRYYKTMPSFTKLLYRPPNVISEIQTSVLTLSLSLDVIFSFPQLFLIELRLICRLLAIIFTLYNFLCCSPFLFSIIFFSLGIHFL